MHRNTDAIHYSGERFVQRMSTVCMCRLHLSGAVRVNEYKSHEATLYLLCCLQTCSLCVIATDARLSIYILVPQPLLRMCVEG